MLPLVWQRQMWSEGTRLAPHCPALAATRWTRTERIQGPTDSSSTLVFLRILLQVSYCQCGRGQHPQKGS